MHWEPVMKAEFISCLFMQRPNSQLIISDKACKLQSASSLNNAKIKRQHKRLDKRRRNTHVERKEKVVIIK